MDDRWPAHHLMLDGYSDNPLLSPLIARVDEVRQQGVPVQEGFTLERDGGLWHYSQYSDDVVHPFQAEPKPDRPWPRRCRGWHSSSAA
jgi:hypothetical protein